MSAIFTHLFKLNVIVAGGALITLCLFYLMQDLINVDFEVPPDAISLNPAIIIEPEIEIVVARITPKPPEPLVPEEQPDLPELPPAVPGAGPGSGFVPNERVVLDMDSSASGFFVADANAVPIVQIAPAYPNNALNRGIEGYVIIEFDVSEQGLVINPRVLYSEPPDIFERAALKALERWRYQPKMVDGKEVKMYGQQARLSFNLED